MCQSSHFHFLSKVMILSIVVYVGNQRTSPEWMYWIFVLHYCLQGGLTLTWYEALKDFTTVATSEMIHLLREIHFVLYNRHKKAHEACSVMSDSLQPHGLHIHGILQARKLEWVAVPFSRESSQPRDWTQVSHIAGGFFTSWATREAQEYWSG